MKKRILLGVLSMMMVSTHAAEDGSVVVAMGGDNVYWQEIEKKSREKGDGGVLETMGQITAPRAKQLLYHAELYHACGGAVPADMCAADALLLMVDPACGETGIPLRQQSAGMLYEKVHSIVREIGVFPPAIMVMGIHRKPAISLVPLSQAMTYALCISREALETWSTDTFNYFLEAAYTGFRAEEAWRCRMEMLQVIATNVGKGAVFLGLSYCADLYAPALKDFAVTSYKSLVGVLGIATAMGLVYAYKKVCGAGIYQVDEAYNQAMQDIDKVRIVWAFAAQQEWFAALAQRYAALCLADAKERALSR